MAGVQRFVSKKEIKCSAEKYFDAFKNHLTDLPKIHPEIYKGCEILEGDGKSLGTVRRWTYVLAGNPKVLFVKERLSAIDEVNKSITLTVLDGDLLEHYKSFDLIIRVTPKDHEGSVAEWIVEYEKKHENITTPDVHYQDLFGTVCLGLDAHHHSKA